MVPYKEAFSKGTPVQGAIIFSRRVSHTSNFFHLVEAFCLGVFGMGGFEGVSYVKLVLGNPGAAVVPTRTADRGS